jgi:alkanesulfonate monooxygenase SsuD/methylene tetrahydromethanopterin reductase-like flavin-dependent oxidoreductase (luciferase family)
MRIGVGIDDRLGLSREQQRQLVQECTRLGYESLWSPANVSNRSHMLTCLLWWQASAELVPGGLMTGVSVVPFPSWTPVALAQQAATVAEITGGKFILGVGLGSYPSPQLREQLNLPDRAPIPYTREFITPLRGLLRGETVNGIKLGVSGLPVPVYLGALGPQVLRLAGQITDGVLPNWSSPEQIAWMREQVNADIPIAHYIRVCVHDDEDAARRAFAANMLGYAMARPGQSKDKGYRGHFARMGFDDALSELERRRDAGEPMEELADAMPAELMRRVGYFGRPEGAAAELKRLSAGLDEAMVRLITVRDGDLDACVKAATACQPSGWR